MKHRRRSWWTKCKERIVLSFTARIKEEKIEKEGQKKNRRRETSPGKAGRWLFLFLLLGQNWLCVNAAAEGLQRRTEMMERMPQQEVQVKESRQMDGGDSTQVETAERSRRDRNEKRREEIEVHFAKWIGQEFAIFFAIEHRLRKDEMEEQFNKVAKGRMEVCGRRGENHG